MKLTFVHAGQTRTLVKHPEVAAALARGEITEADAARRPWYLRLKIGEKYRTFKLAGLSKADATAEARDFLTNRDRRPNDFAAFLQAQDNAKSITLGDLAAEWITLACPHRTGQPRELAAVERLKAQLRHCLPFWQTVPVATVDFQTIEKFAAWRQPHLRSADLELSALSSLCSWASLTGRIKLNPFEKRKPLAECKRHCYEVAPHSDEMFHQVCAWLFDREEPQEIIVGGLLCYQGLSGQRPAEPLFLTRQPVLDRVPTAAEVRTLAPGTFYRDRNAVLRLKVHRLKHGQNPVIEVHAPLEAFLSAWRAWLAQTLPDAEKLFPLVYNQNYINATLAAACKALGLPQLTPHGFRAYNVAVLRSSGLDDATIASRLGQTTGGKLIHTTYGNPDDAHGGALLDFLPEPTATPCWHLLTAKLKTPARYISDTSATPQDAPTSPNLPATKAQ